MISKVQFWRLWPNSLKIALAIFSVISLVLAGISAFWFFNDLHNVLHWDIASELHKKFIASEAFVEKGLRFTNNELIYYIKEWYLPANEVVNIKASWILFGSLILGISLISTALSFQNNFWFLGSLLILAAFLMLSRTEIIFQSTNNLPFMVAFVALGLLLFFFNSFLKKASFWLRFSLILALFLGFTIISLNFSKVNFPLVALTNYGLLFSIICFAIFVFFIAHEIVVALIYTVISSSEKGKNSFKTYLGIGIIYLLNCLLIYLENIKLIEDSFMVISPVLLFAISSILGIWGFKKQCEDTDVFSFQRTGAWLYMGFLIISISVLGFVYATANDPLIELLNDYIAIAHLALGLVFFAHVILNFIGVFQNGLNAYLVLYKPKFNSIILAKILGVFIMGFFLIQKDIYAYNQLKAGLNNAIADFYLAEGENTAAETYYKESVKSDFFNHKANYALAGMAKNVGDRITAAYFYRQAIQKNPSEFAYVGLSQNLESEDLFFDALFTLREGSAKFPDSKILATNSSHLLEKANVRDSVYLYLDKAMQNCGKCDVERVNLQAFWIENALASKLDSVAASFADEKYPSNLANQLAISRMTGKVKSQLKELPKNTALNTAAFGGIYNQIALPENSLTAPDSVWDDYINNMANQRVSEDLRYLKALQLYQKDEKILALKQLTYLAQDHSEAALMYRRKLGLWYLNEGIFDRAVAFMTAAGDNQSTQVLIDNNFKSHLTLKQLQQADEILQLEINEENYKDIYKKAPFNPYILTDIADFLSSKGKETEAYNMVFNALEFNESSAELWKKYSILALQNGVPDYAENGTLKLQKLLSAEDFKLFMTSFNQEKERIQKQQNEF